nr:archaellin/type IV pilin N-terminal domain-containing protein [Methanofervidicoccus abyssi]
MKFLEYLKSKRGAMGIGTLIIFIAMVLVAAVAASVLINTSGFLQQKASSTGKQSTEQVASGLFCSGVSGHIFTFDGNYYDLDRMIMYISPNAGSAPIDLKEAKLFLTYDGKSVILKYGGTIPATAGCDNLFELTNTGEVNITSSDYTSITLVDDGTNNKYIIITTSDHKIMALLKEFDGKNVNINANNTLTDSSASLNIVSYNGTEMVVNITTNVASSGTASSTSLDWAYISSDSATWGGTDDKQFLVVPLQDNDKSVVNNAVINKGDLVAILINTEAAFSSGIPERKEITGKLQPEFGAPAVIDIVTPAAYTSEVINLQ